MLSKRAAKLAAVTVHRGWARWWPKARKNFTSRWDRAPGVSVMNPYGSISVKPSPGNTVMVNAILHSDKVEVDNNQSGNRVDIQSHLLPGADA